MSLIGREMRYHTPFGPVIMHSTISDELHELLLRTANQLRDGTHPNKKINKKTNDYRGRLAGCLSEEYSYDKAFTPSEDKIIIEEMTWLASMFVEFAFKAGKIKKERLRKPNELIMQRPVWVNYKKAGEWNPAHNHTGAISCVTYLQVPPEIEQENNRIAIIAEITEFTTVLNNIYSQLTKVVDFDELSDLLSAINVLYSSFELEDNSTELETELNTIPSSAPSIYLSSFFLR